MRYDINILNTYVEKGLIEKNKHPLYPIYIYNYSRECQFAQAWDEITLACRGLVLDDEGNVVARPFKKFFNMEELKSIPNEPFEVFEKMDGSLGILFRYKTEWVFASKGSFTSDQAIKFEEIFNRRHHTIMLSGCNTYLFEIIYPENRIVVDYGDTERVVLLGEIHTESGEELDLEFNKQLGFDVVKKYDGVTDYKQLKSMVKDNQEGFIVRFKSGMRMKIKGEEYVRLHRLLTNFSNVDIWECLKDGKNINELLERVPDEFDAWVKKTISNLKYAYYQIEERAGKMFDYYMYGKYNDQEPETDKKKFAEWVKAQDRYLQPILFRMFDKKDYSDIIWKYIRPVYSKPFWNKEPA